MQSTIIFQSNKYELSHLKGFSIYLDAPRTDAPNFKCEVRVKYSWHCYTRSPDTRDNEADIMTVDRERRIFCTERHKYSFLLPELVEALPSMRCQNTGKGNFVRIKDVEIDGVKRDYGVYFSIKKPARGKHMELFVESAYIHDLDKYMPKMKPIRFDIIVYNRKHNRPIKG